MLKVGKEMESDTTARPSVTPPHFAWDGPSLRLVKCLGLGNKLCGHPRNGQNIDMVSGKFF